MGSCRARSVYLATRLLGRLSPLNGLPVLCTFFRQKLTTALLRWIIYIINMCTKANRTLGFLRRNFYSCLQDVKSSILRTCSPDLAVVFGIPRVWSFKKKLKKVQNGAARFVTSNYCFETGSMTGILEKIRWESLKKMERDSRVLYKGLTGAAIIPTNVLIHPSPTPPHPTPPHPHPNPSLK